MSSDSGRRQRADSRPTEAVNDICYHLVKISRLFRRQERGRGVPIEACSQETVTANPIDFIADQLVGT